MAIGQAAEKTDVACTCINLVVSLDDLISGEIMKIAASKFAEWQNGYQQLGKSSRILGLVEHLFFFLRNTVSLMLSLEQRMTYVEKTDTNASELIYDSQSTDTECEVVLGLL